MRLLAVSDKGAKTRKVLARYDISKVRITMVILAIATTCAYAAYTLLGETAAMFNPRDLVWTIPFVLVGLWRFNALTGRAEQGQKPNRPDTERRPSWPTSRPGASPSFSSSTRAKLGATPRLRSAS